MTEDDLPPRLAALPAKQRAELVAYANKLLDEAPEPSATSVAAVGELLRQFAFADAITPSTRREAS